MTSCTGARNQFAETAQSEEAKLERFQHALFNATPHNFVTPTIVFANVAIFVIMLVTSASSPFRMDVAAVLEWGANNGPRTMNGEWWRLFTSMFLHFGIIHLGFNMWVLWNVGQIVERLVGNVGFVLLYVTSGLFGSVASLAWNPATISAGASGAVFGVVGALIGFILLRRDTVPHSVINSIRGSIGAFVMYNLILGFAIPNIDMAAHIGGFVAGCVCGLICSQPLSPNMTAGRVWRNTLGLVAGTACLLIAIYALPNVPSDNPPAFSSETDRQLKRFLILDGKAINALNDLFRERDQGLNGDVLADRVERDVMPLWIECRDRMGIALKNPGPRRELLESLREYADVRIQSCRVLAVGFRERNQEKLQQFNQLDQSASKLIQEINSSQR